MGYEFDWDNKLIEITSPQVEVEIQDLINRIRTEEASVTGITHDKIADASGKESLGGDVAVGITVELLNDWQLHFWSGSYTATIKDGNLVGGISGDVISFTAGVQVVLIQSAASTIVTTGTGLTATNITDIKDAVSSSLATDIGITKTATQTNASESLITKTAIQSHASSSSTQLTKILGLVHSNFRISSPVFDSNGNMTSATIKTYSTGSDASSDANVLKTYTVTATYDGSGNLSSYLSREA